MYTERTKAFGDVTMMFFDKLDRLVSEIIDFVDSIIDSTVLCFFLPIKVKPRLRFDPMTFGSWNGKMRFSNHLP
jgi:hypothetical protein